METKVTLKSLLEKGRVFAPCIWDCVSAKAAEMSGFKAALLSSGCMSFSMLGLPDLGLLTLDDVLLMTERITNISPLPLIVDAEDGYGDSPVSTYWTAKRLAKAGASALTLDDTTGLRGWQRIVGGQQAGYDVVPVNEWLAKVKAALDALDGTDCLLIARTEAMYRYGLDEAIERCVRAAEIGAPMTLVIGLTNIEQCRQINERVPGLKMYPDVFVHDGKPDVVLSEVEPLGFRLVTAHCLETAAMRGMVEYGTENRKNESTVYSVSQGMGDLIPKGRDPFGKMKWVEMEAEYIKMFQQ